MLVLNALLGLGTVLAPVFVALFLGLGFWWGLPVISTLLLVALLVASVRLPLRVQPPATRRGERGPRSLSILDLRGVCRHLRDRETVNGNWAQLDMTRQLGASRAVASLALTTFWASVTVGRVLFATIQSRVPTRLTYHLLPFLVAGAFVIIALLRAAKLLSACLRSASPASGARRCCRSRSAWAKRNPPHCAGIAGGVMRSQFGYGIAAFGIGPLVDGGVSLATIYALRNAPSAWARGRSRLHATGPARLPFIRDSAPTSSDVCVSQPRLASS